MSVVYFNLKLIVLFVTLIHVPVLSIGKILGNQFKIANTEPCNETPSPQLI